MLYFESGVRSSADSEDRQLNQWRLTWDPNLDLCVAASDGRLEEVERLLADTGPHRCVPGWAGGMGKALHQAARHNHVTICTRLLSAGWSSTVRDVHSDTPLHRLARRPTAVEPHFQVSIRLYTSRHITSRHVTLHIHTLHAHHTYV